MIPETPRLRILLGPTASGKESIALAIARQLSCGIISVDSMKVYTHLDIGTAKASAAVRAEVPHACIDLVEPTEEFTVARYLEAAETAIAACVEKGETPLLSGGTALYYKNLLEGLFDGPGEDPALRDELKQRAEAEGADALYAELKEVDPVAAEKLHPHDVRRVVRALEVHALTGQPLSAWQTQWRDSHTDETYRYAFSMVALDWPRELLYKRIEARVDRMMEAGLVEEARWVHACRDTIARTPLQAVAYKELFPYFNGETSLDEAVDTLKKNTRHLAKSQMTWFRKFPCQWLPMREGESAEATAARVLAAWQAQGNS